MNVNFPLLLLVFGMFFSKVRGKVCFPEAHPVLWASPQGDSHFGSKTTYQQAREELVRTLKAGTLPNPGDTCKPVHFYYLGRHSIRYPVSKEFALIEETFPRVRKNLLEGGRLSVALRRELTHWQFTMNSSKAAQVTESGREETAAIARQYYTYFPSVLDLNQTTFEVGYTSKIRTKQTADAFVKSLASQQVGNISQAELDQKFSMTLNDRLLTCFLTQNSNTTGPSKAQLANSEAARAMVCQFNARYGLTGHAKATFDDLVILHQLCGYEISQKQKSSPWCKLFTIGEMQLIEYLRDVYDYFNKLVSLKDFVGDTVMSDLYEKLATLVEKRSHSEGSGAQTSATLYFTHDCLLKRLVNYLGVYPPLPNSSTIAPCLSLDRPIRTSTFLAFNSHFVVVLYRCEASNKYKLATLWNEVPITIKGCSSALCDFEEFAQHYRNVKPVPPRL